MEIRKFRPDIEGLRALAIVLVILQHAGLSVPGGFIGVDVFFVISGFLITKHLFDEVNSTGTVSISKFYARRILRIFPASIAIILLTLLASYIWLSPLQLINYCWDALTSILFSINYRLAITGSDYFNVTTVPSPFRHYWSLAIEEQFYFIWPIIIFLISKIKFVKKHFKSVLSSILVIIIAISLYESANVTGTYSIWAYFSLHTRAWELAIGSLLAVNIKSFIHISPKIGSLLSWAGLIGIITGAVLINDTTPYPGLWALIPTISTAVMILAGVNKNRYSFESLASVPIIQWIGKISFSWYLVHWPLFVIMLLTKGEHIRTRDKVIAILLSFVLANISYFVIENPIRFNPYFKNSIKKTLILGISLLLVGAVCSGGIILIKNYLEKQTSQNTVSHLEVSEDENILAKKIQEATQIKDLPKNISLEKVVKDGSNRDCIANLDVIDINKYKCILGDKNSSKTMILVGDSHANQWIKPIDIIAKKRGYKLITYFKSGCTLVDIKYENADFKRDYTECFTWRDAVLAELKNLKPNIIITSSYDYPMLQAPTYTALIQKLKLLTDRLVVIADTPKPIPYLIIPECLAANTNNIQKCSFKRDEAEASKDTRSMEKEVLTKENVDHIDPFPWFCTSQACPPVINNMVVYWDNSHIGTDYSIYLTNLLEAKMSSVLN